MKATLALVLLLATAVGANAQNLRDQHLGQWQRIGIPDPTAFYALARLGDSVYVIGGVGSFGTSIPSSRCVQRFRLIPESGVEEFASFETAPPRCGSRMTAVAYQGAIYLISAGSDTEIYRAAADASGRLGPWVTVGQVRTSSVDTAVVLQDYLIVFAQGIIDRARINPDGSVSAAWEIIGAVGAGRVVTMTATHIYLGGSTWAAIDLPNARFGPWTTSGSGYGSGAAIVADMLYTWGSNEACFARTCPSFSDRRRILADGSLGPRESTTGAGGSGWTGALGLAIGRHVYSFGGGAWDVNNDYPRAAESVRRAVVGGPIVTNVNPTSSPEVGGITVAIDGRNFDPGVTVTLGNDPPLPLQATHAERLEALIPVDRFRRNGGSQLTLTIANPDRGSWALPFFITETLPRSPQNFSANAGSASVTFTWQTPASGGPVFTGYELEIGTSPGSSNTGVFALGSVTSVQVTLGPGLYYARLRTRNAVGRSEPTPEVSFVIGDPTGAPAAPQALSASVTFARVGLQWQPGSGPQPVSGYVLEVGSAPGLANLLVQNVGSTTALSVDGVPLGRYYVRVRAFNASGVSGPSNEVEVVVSASMAAPGPPRNLAATLNGRTVTLTWLAPTSGGVVAAYVVEAGTGQGLSNIGSFQLGQTPTVTFAGVPPATYYVRVRAANAGGTSGPSNEIAIIVVP